MSARVGNCTSNPRHIQGGSPQGSILGCLLFTLTTDGLDAEIDYSENEGNEAVLEREDDIDRFQVDMSLARIVSDAESRLGINNITVERREDCLLYTSPSPRDRQKSRMPSSA